VLTLVVLLKTQHLTYKKEKRKTFLSVKLIFKNHWNDYLKAHSVRTCEKEAVESMLSCKDEKRGCFVCYCKKCNQFKIVSFGCNSRLCSSCGKRHTDRWAEMLAKKVRRGIIHRHLVFSLPVELRGSIKQNRKLQKVISDSAFKAI